MTTDEQLAARATWIAALRSGEYSQTRGSLCDKSGFCCLGVAAELTPGIRKQREPFTAYGEEETGGGLPRETAEWLGLTAANGDPRIVNPWEAPYRALIDLNDVAGWTFEEIANVLEAQPDDWNGRTAQD